MIRRFSPECQSALVALLERPDESGPVPVIQEIAGRMLGWSPRPRSVRGSRVTCPGAPDRWERYRRVAHGWVEEEIARRTGHTESSWKPARKAAWAERRLLRMRGE
jgi:hypothetical protein